MNLYFDELDARYLSAPLWAGIDLNNLLRQTDSRRGVAMFDDFIGFGGILASTAGTYQSGVNRWGSYETASSLLTNVALTPTPATVSPTSLGAIRLGATAALNDNDTQSLQWGKHPLTPFGTFPFAVIPGISNDLVFETRYSVASVAVNIGNWFIGLAGAATVDPTTAVIPFTAADQFAVTLSVLGFGKLAADTSDIDLFYGRAGAIPTAKDTTKVNVADAYMKVGFRYYGAKKTLSIFVNGVEITSQALSTAITAVASWPTDYMTPIIALMQKDANTWLYPTVDWVACAQLPPLVQ